MARRIGDEAGVAVALGNLAESAAITGDVAEARQRFEEALAASAALGSRQRLIEQNFQIGQFELAEGSLDLAREAFERAVRLAEEARLPFYVLLGRIQLAMCDLEGGDPDALERFDRALAAALDDPDLATHPINRQMFISFRADIETRARNFDKAAMLLGASLSIEEKGSPPDWAHQMRLDRVNEIVREGLDAGEWEEAIEAGRKLDDAAITAMILGRG